MSSMPNQYKFDNLKLGQKKSTMPTQYQFDNLNNTLFEDFDLGGKNAGKGALKSKTDSNSKLDFAKSLLGNSSGYKPQASNYQFTPSMVDYSQYIGLSPITQRYLYGGM